MNTVTISFKGKPGSRRGSMMRLTREALQYCAYHVEDHKKREYTLLVTHPEFIKQKGKA